MSFIQRNCQKGQLQSELWRFSRAHSLFTVDNVSNEGGRRQPLFRRVVVPDVTSSGIYDETSRQIMLRAGACACQSTPLFGQSGALRGVLSTYYRIPKGPPPGSLQNLDLLGQLAADIIERLESDELVRSLASLVARGELPSEMAHDINNPLQALSNLLVLLEVDGQSGEEHERLVRQLERVSAVVHKLKLVARPKLESNFMKA